jgi:hypothetical protein
MSDLATDLAGTETIQSIEGKLEISLPEAHYYAFKIFDDAQKTKAKEKESLIYRNGNHSINRKEVRDQPPLRRRSP